MICVLFFQGVRLAGLDWAVDSHVTVLVRPHVTHRVDGVSVPQEEQDRGVKEVDDTLRWTFINRTNVN